VAEISQVEIGLVRQTAWAEIWGSRKDSRLPSRVTHDHTYLDPACLTRRTAPRHLPTCPSIDSGRGTHRGRGV